MSIFESMLLNYASALDMRRTWVRLLASVKFFSYSVVSILQMQPLRCVGRSNFDKGRHNLTTLIQKSTKTMSNQTLPTRTGPARKVWPTPSYHESHRKTNTGRSCWVSGFKSRPNRIAYG